MYLTVEIILSSSSAQNIFVLLLLSDFIFVVGTDNNLYAINKQNGDVYWKSEIKKQVKPRYDGKNIVGTFHQPKAVFININFLKTLDRKNLLSGAGVKAEGVPERILPDRYG